MKQRSSFSSGLIMVLTSLLVCCAITAAHADRALSRRTKILDKTGNKITEYVGSYALLIGVSDYTAGWPDLPGVKKDIPLVRKALEKKGFAVTTLMDPEGLAMEEGIERFIEQYGNKGSNRLIIYFAGHGHTIKPQYGGDPLGYIVPANGPNPHDAPRSFKRIAMSMQRIEEYSLNMDASHVLFLFDSCFSGSLFAMTRAVPEHISYKTSRHVRQFITSGSAEEMVSDDSLFRAQFIEALGGEGDVNDDGYVTGTELGEFLQRTVVNYSKGAQHPQYGKIRHPKLDKGDFVFVAGGSYVVEQEALQQVHEKSGNLKVVTDPRGARIYVDGVNEGQSPVTLPGLKAGVVEVKAILQGYTEQRERVRIRQGRTSKVTLLLDAVVRTGSLTIKTRPSDAKVRILNINPPYEPGIELEAGIYKIEVSSAGYETATRNVELESGDDMQIPIRLKKQKKSGPVAGKTWKEPVTGMEFVHVKGGCFQMGDTFGDGANDEKPVHEVCVDGFWMGKYEVTQGQYERITGSNPSRFKKGNNYPVEKVSWNDARSYIKKLNTQSGKTFRLPTEAEWEYAAREGGKRVRFGTGRDTIGPDEANFDASSKYKKSYSRSGTYREQTTAAGSFAPNKLGLHDMSGNVWEWCSDWYGENYYSSSPRNNPQGVSSGSNRVIRGGGWDDVPRFVRAANRLRYEPDYRINNLGFRLLFSEGS